MLVTTRRVICPVLVEGNHPTVAGEGAAGTFLFAHLNPGNPTRILIGVGVPSPVGGEVNRGVNVFLPLFPRLLGELTAALTDTAFFPDWVTCTRGSPPTWDVRVRGVVKGAVFALTTWP